MADAEDLPNALNWPADRAAVKRDEQLRMLPMPPMLPMLQMRRNLSGHLIVASQAVYAACHAVVWFRSRLCVVETDKHRFFMQVTSRDPGRCPIPHGK
jgi:hypothetical protein